MVPLGLNHPNSKTLQSPKIHNSRKSEEEVSV